LSSQSRLRCCRPQKQQNDFFEFPLTKKSFHLPFLPPNPLHPLPSINRSMQSLSALTQAQGCAVDGTSAAANPLAQLVNQSLGMSTQKGQIPRGMFQPGQQAPAGPQSEIERGMAMGLHPGSQMHGPPAGPIGWGQAPKGGADMAFVREFEQQFRNGGQQQQLMGAPPQSWVQDFDRMRVNPMESAYQQQFHGGNRAQAWAHDMARGPRPPSEMEMVWRQQQVRYFLCKRV